MPVSAQTNADDVARVLYALGGHSARDRDIVQEGLKNLLQEHVAPDLKEIIKRFPIKSDPTFPLYLDVGAKIFLGGGGVVLQATNGNVPGLKYGLKVQRPSLIRKKDAVAEGKRALDEYIYHAPLSHENIARLFGAWTVHVLSTKASAYPGFSETPVFIMEWIEKGKGLNQYLQLVCKEMAHEKKSGAPMLTAKLLQAAFSGLSHLHDHDLIHWDMKSDNLLVDEHGAVKLMDIGNARWRDGKQPQLRPGAPVDLIALTTEGNFPPVLAKFEQKRPRGTSSKRVVLELDSTLWDHPWLDMWMLAREAALLIGLCAADAELPSSLRKLPKTVKFGSPEFLRTAFRTDDPAASYVLKYLRLVLRRLMFPENMDQPRYYDSALAVTEDLAKIDREFGAAQALDELRAIPRHVLRLPIDGNVPFTPRIKALIGSTPLRRLKKHMQLGLLSEVYPGAGHKRFEHAIGAFFTTCQYVKALYSDRTNVFWRISMERRDIEALLLAALLHDVGHIAFGHFLEEMEGLFQNITHEDYAQCMLQSVPDGKLRAGNPISSARQDRDIIKRILIEHWIVDEKGAAELLELAAEILRGPSTDSPTVPRNANEAVAAIADQVLFRNDAELMRDHTRDLKIQILHSIIESAIDADKLDYLRRDGVHAGVTYPQGIDVDRFLQAMTTLSHISLETRLFRTLKAEIRENPDNIPRLRACVAVTDKGRLPVESILFARYQMFQSVYWHHTARAHTAALQFCVQEYLFAAGARAHDALCELLNIFRESTDDSALSWLGERLHEIGSPARQALLSACAGLQGDREKTYRECFILRYKGHDDHLRSEDVATVYDSLMAVSRRLQSSKTPAEFVQRWRGYRAEFSRDLGQRLGSKFVVEGDILMDIPPAGRDQVRNVFVIEPDGPHLIQDMSAMADAVRDAFRYWTRHFRVFCSPAFLARCKDQRITRADLSDHCWRLLKDRHTKEPAVGQLFQTE